MEDRVQKKMVEMEKRLTGDMTNQQTVSSEQKEAQDPEIVANREHLKEIQQIAQRMIDAIKAELKNVTDPFERAWILGVVSEKCRMVAGVNYAEAMSTEEGSESNVSTEVNNDMPEM